jgi:hypothetical protein
MKAAVLAGWLFVTWLSCYWWGLWPWLGFASVTRSSFGAGSIAIVGENYRGFDVGLDDFVFYRGQEVVIEYDAEVRAGSLWFHVFQPWDGLLGDGATHYVSESGKGVWTVPVHETGLYHITIEGSPSFGKGSGWDLTYDVKWGARRAEGG